MSTDTNQFQSNHSIQFNNIGDDLRFYADQRFKITTAFLIASGFLISVAATHQNISIGVLGIIISYLCLSWEKRITQWWAILYEGLKRIEKLYSDQKAMEVVYQLYPRQSLFPFVKARKAIEGLYYLAIVGWAIFICISWPKLW
ncbi:MAG: hypothetical protein C4539_02905 [Ignavibacteriales bacterium]|nr:MAG: hypothetical protein C4539_02905 [Ignavibacteriales bacterium]